MAILTSRFLLSRTDNKNPYNVSQEKLLILWITCHDWKYDEHIDGYATVVINVRN